MKNFTIFISQDNAAKVTEWLQDRGGVSKWESLDMSDPSWGCLTPTLTPEGESTPRPHWKAAKTPLTVRAKDDVGVLLLKEVRRFPVTTRRSTNGFSLKLTASSANKLDKAMEVIKRNLPTNMQEFVSYEFDYFSGEAVILAPIGQPVSLEEFNA